MARVHKAFEKFTQCNNSGRQVCPPSGTCPLSPPGGAGPARSGAVMKRRSSCSRPSLSQRFLLCLLLKSSDGTLTGSDRIRTAAGPGVCLDLGTDRWSGTSGRTERKLFLGYPWRRRTGSRSDRASTLCDSLLYRSARGWARSCRCRCCCCRSRSWRMDMPRARSRCDLPTACIPVGTGTRTRTVPARPVGTGTLESLMVTWL